MTKAADILAGCRLFSRVPAQSMDRLREMAIVRRFARESLIFRQDQACPGVFVVGAGMVRVFKTAPNGKEHVLHLVGPGGTFAEVAAIGGFPCPAFAQALEDTSCALLPAQAFARALARDHALCLGLLASLAGWVKHMVGMVEDIALRDAAGRVARYLLAQRTDDQGRIRLPSLKKHLASHLNLTSETLSRTLRRLAEAGLIHTGQRQGLRVSDRRGLEQLAAGDLPGL